MSEQLQLRRGPASIVGTMIGAQGEPIFDTTNNRLTLHDGMTPGGWPAARIGDMAVGPTTGAMTQAGIVEAVLSLSGATVTGPAFPQGALILGVSVRVATAISGATSFSVGIDTGSTSLYLASVAAAAGSSGVGVIGVGLYWSATHLTISAIGGSFTGGSVKVAIHYINISAPS